MRIKTGLLAFAALVVTTSAFAWSGLKKTTPPSSDQIVFLVHNADKRIERGDKGLEYEMNSLVYAKSGLNYALADIRMNRDPATRVLALIDDRVPFEAIAQVGEMAINAGFTNVHLYVCFHKTGSMAELTLGPAMKFSQNPPDTANGK